MTLHMPCSACGFHVSAVSHSALVASYFDHVDAVHPKPPRVTSVDALRKLVSLVQTRG